MDSKKENQEKLDLSVFDPKSNFSIPNVISVIRLAMIPLILWLYLSGREIAAVLVVVLSGISDAVDGYIARHFNQITPLGKVLDPLADKLTQIAMVLCFITTFPMIIPLLIVLLVKEALMLYWGVQLLKAGQPPFCALWWGKVATFGFYLGMVIIMAFSNKMGVVGVSVITTIITLLMLNSMIRYGIVFRQKIRSAAEAK